MIILPRVGSCNMSIVVESHLSSYSTELIKTKTITTKCGGVNNLKLKLKTILMNTAMKLIMNRINDIICNSQAISFTITGYPHLKTRLVLHFDDCDQVYDFKWLTKDTFEESAPFFSEDRDYFQHSTEFSALYSKVQPEQK